MAGSPGTRLGPDPLDGPREALVIATTSYEDPGLRQLRSPARDVEDLAGVLGDPRVGAFTVTRVIDQDERQVRRAVNAFLSARGHEDLVVVYLSCHGVLDRRGRLYFAAADTLKAQLGSTGIPSAWLLEELDECRARRQVLILDCCFSGAFAHGGKGDADLDLKRRLAGQGRGRAVLTASRAGEYSFEGQALPGAVVAGSVFTAGLVEGLRTGAADASGDGYVTLDEAYEFAYGYVLSSGASQTPQHWLYGGEGAIVLARSPAGPVIAPAPLPEALVVSLDSPYPAIRIGAVTALGEWVTGDDPARVLAAEEKLRQIADTDIPAVAAAARACLPSPERAAAVIGSPARNIRADGNTTGGTAQTAREPIQGDRDRAARLIAEAERTAQSITDGYGKVLALLGVVEALAATDPDRVARLITDAERTAQSITFESSKASALLGVVEALAATDPDRAARLITDAERTAQSITIESAKASALLGVVRALAATDPDRAERTARSITDENCKVMALCGVANAVAATDPDRAARLITDAERTAQSITDEDFKASALCGVAEALAATDPDRAARLITDAERTAQSITRKSRKSRKAWALLWVAKAVAATDPDRAARLITDAERTARSITFEHNKAWALRDVARALAATDPDRAESAARSITDEHDKASALRDVAVALAATDPDRAERIAQSIASKSEKAPALCRVARALAATDPDRAARLITDADRAARSITDEHDKASALRDVAVALAATDPDRAERTARSITDEYLKTWALLWVAEPLAATDPTAPNASLSRLPARARRH